MFVLCLIHFQVAVDCVQLGSSENSLMASLQTSKLLSGASRHSERENRSFSSRNRMFIKLPKKAEAIKSCSCCSYPSIRRIPEGFRDFCCKNLYVPVIHRCASTTVFSEKIRVQGKREREKSNFDWILWRSGVSQIILDGVFFFHLQK